LDVLERYDAFALVEAAASQAKRLARDYLVEDITDEYEIPIPRSAIDTTLPRVDERGATRTMHAYLTAAVMREGDIEAWVNVAILAGNTGDSDLFTASAITGDRLNKGHYMTEFVRQLRATIADADVREEMLVLLRRTIDSAT
jgi:hypothetical protein